MTSHKISHFIFPFFKTSILIILISSSVFCQELDHEVYYNQILSFENSKTNILLNVGIVAASTGAMFLLDNSIRNNLKLENYNNKSYLKFANQYGVYTYHFGLAAAMYLSQIVTDNKKIANTGKVLLESLVVSGLASISIKYIFGRSRPYKNEGNTKFNWFETENINNSLPSGHVITVFTTATVLSNSLDNVYASIGLYSLSGLTAYQRIASDNHWFSDVFLGASLGYLIGEYFSNMNEKMNLIPFFSKSGTGVYFQLNL